MDLRVGAPPFKGAWSPVVGPWLVPAVLAAALLVVAGPRAARRMRWGALLAASVAAAGVWTVALAVAGGGFDRVAAPLDTRWDYLAAVPLVASPGAFLDGFVEALGELPLHARSHPPGAVLVFWAMGAVGAGGPGWASALVITAGASSVAAVLLALRELGGEHVARRAAPFLVAAPAAVWVATSADALFAGAGAWAVALLVAATGRTGARAVGLGVAGGIAAGLALMLSYGVVLLGFVPAAAVVARRRWDVAVTGAAGAAAVLVAVAAAGFSWLDGLDAARAEYWRGVASVRPYSWFLLLNLAAAAVAVGPAALAGLARLARSRPPWMLLPAGALVAVAVADVSGLSKGEVERIWLPFFPWIAAAAAALPLHAAGRWLAGSAGTGLAVQVLLRSPW